MPHAAAAIRPLPAAERSAARSLLAAAALPVAGLDDPATELYGLTDAAGLGALVGIELRPPSALLRSLVVAPRLRGRGYGRLLLDFAERLALERGAVAAYGLTTTIPELLERSGYQELPRAELPPELHASAELQGACPAHARAYRKAL